MKSPASQRTIFERPAGPRLRYFLVKAPFIEFVIASDDAYSGFEVLKGHGFSRAAKSLNSTGL
jgi:hypothetical protein